MMHHHPLALDFPQRAEYAFWVLLMSCFLSNKDFNHSQILSTNDFMQPNPHNKTCTTDQKYKTHVLVNAMNNLQLSVLCHNGNGEGKEDNYRNQRYVVLYFTNEKDSFFQALYIHTYIHVDIYSPTWKIACTYYMVRNCNFSSFPS